MRIDTVLNSKDIAVKIQATNEQILKIFTHTTWLGWTLACWGTRGRF
jgi:hypothetical protein